LNQLLLASQLAQVPSQLVAKSGKMTVMLTRLMEELSLFLIFTRFFVFGRQGRFILLASKYRLIANPSADPIASHSIYPNFDLRIDPIVDPSAAPSVDPSASPTSV
jgi:hypothetical protein